MRTQIIAAITFLGGGFVLAVLGLATKAYIAGEVASQLAEAGIVPAHEVAAIRTDVDDNTDDIDDIEDRWNALVDALAASRD
jgi:hypothetical protein